jgi:hypothetical protein
MLQFQTLFRQLRLPAQGCEGYSVSEFPGLDPSKVPLPSTTERLLTGLSKVNFVVGPNNSGKSRLLRSLFLGKLPETNDDVVWCRALERVRSSAIELAKADPSKYAGLLQFATAWDLFEPSNESYASRLQRFQRSLYNEAHRYPNARPVEVEQFLREACAGLPAGEVVGGTARATSPVVIYVPVLRSLRRIERATVVENYYGSTRDITAMPLRHSFVNAYLPARRETVRVDGFPDDGPSEVNLLTGEELHDILTNYLLGTLQQRKRIAEFQRFLSDRFFEGQSVTLIPERKNHFVKLKLGHEREQKIEDLGDGLQQLLVLTFPLFLVPEEQPLVVVVEEPEQCLHPGQQRALLDAWINAGSKVQFFATTHSNHFLDRTVEIDAIRVFRIDKSLPSEGGDERVPTFKITPWSHDDFTLLASIGVLNSSTLLTNATIWVEGITDRLYLRRYLELVQIGVSPKERMREDVHYSFVEYGGSGIDHWSFLNEKDDQPRIEVERLCAKLFLVADSPGTRAGIRQRHEMLRKRLGDRFYELNCKEVEHLLTPAVVAQVAAVMNGVTVPASGGEVDRRTTASLKTAIEKALGSTLRREIVEPGKNKVKDSLKLDFCQTAVQALRRVEEMSEEAESLANRLLSFVRAQNR